MAATREKGPRIVLDRTYDAPLRVVWEMWTTKEGIESWWGPDGFATRVLKLDVRVGGTLHYEFTATAAEQIAFLKERGMPTTTSTRGTYTEVSPRSRLAFDQLADFIPDVEPYEIATRVEFQPVAGGIRMVLTLDRMHDAFWTSMMEIGWKNEMEKLARVLEARA